MVIIFVDREREGFYQVQDMPSGMKGLFFGF